MFNKFFNIFRKKATVHNVLSYMKMYSMGLYISFFMFISPDCKFGPLGKKALEEASITGLTWAG